jgi:hypothetical protein
LATIASASSPRERRKTGLRPEKRTYQWLRVRSGKVT